METIITIILAVLVAVSILYFTKRRSKRCGKNPHCSSSCSCGCGGCGTVKKDKN